MIHFNLKSVSVAEQINKMTIMFIQIGQKLLGILLLSFGNNLFFSLLEISHVIHQPTVNSLKKCRPLYLLIFKNFQSDVLTYIFSNSARIQERLIGRYLSSNANLLFYSRFKYEIEWIVLTFTIEKYYGLLTTSFHNKRISNFTDKQKRQQYFLSAK